MQHRHIGRRIIPHEAIGFVAKWIHWTQKYFTGCNEFVRHRMDSDAILFYGTQYYRTQYRSNGTKHFSVFELRLGIVSKLRFLMVTL